MILRPIAFTLLSLGFACAVTPEPATLTVQVDKPGIRISPSLYGLFHEDWAYAADGGLYPEKIRNRSFLYPDQPKYWSLLRTGDAKAFMATDGENTLNPIPSRKTPTPSHSNSRRSNQPFPSPPTARRNSNTSFRLTPSRFYVSDRTADTIRPHFAHPTR